ncbi:TCR gamma alternate reading frame protein [Aythya fuligula]|uniref:TCR gamma alternate reading frame protein n=1 Tax=Aythya fuligula TaxID=219594 RepID=UPI0013763DFA|nr:TCR gamma alternate reading frame protein [Aythya fuligula]
MMLLAALVATTAWFDVFAQEIPIQTPISITKSGGTTRLQCHFKGVSRNFDSIIIHWYQEKENKAPEWMFYISTGKTSVEENFQGHTYTIERVSRKKICTLTISNIISDDTAIYYCAYWDYYYKVFGTGTKLIVSDKVNSKPENSEILQTKHKDQLLYVCLIENFYPEVIRVQWVDEANKEVTKNVIKGDVWKSTNDKYSVSTWLTLPGNTTNKNYYCKYDHESQENFKLPIQDSSETPSQEEYCSTYSGNSTVFYKDYLMYKAAHLVYLILFLKSSMYYVIVLFFIYRMRTPAKLPGKKT